VLPAAEAVKFLGEDAAGQEEEDAGEGKVEDGA
jgi:hypothetical protein